MVCLDLSALKKTLRQEKEILQELAFPGVPHLGTGAADVCDREQVERDQPPLGADDTGEAPHDLRIGQVLFLRHRRHGEVLLDEELDELRVFGRKAVLAAETPGIEPAQLRVIAPAAFGDVMEDRGDVQQPVALEAGDEAAAQRILVRKLEHREAAHVAHDGEDVLVHGVHVEKIVLHLSDDAPEGGQIPSQDAVLIHASEFVHDAARLLQQGQKSRAVPRIAPEGHADARARAPQCAQRLRRHALQLRMLLHDKKALEDRRRLAFEQVGGVRFEQFADPPELLADLRTVGIPRRKDFGTHVLEQYGIQLGDGFRRAKIGLHQLLAGAMVCSRGIPEIARQAVLVIEQQPVLAAPRGVVQAHAQVLKQPVMPLQLARLLQGNQAAPG